MISMTELLVPAYRERNEWRINALWGILTIHPNLEWVDADLQTADLAARLRAAHRLQTPDALQAATALRAGATAFITNDPVFLRVEGIEAAVLDRYL